MYGRQMEVTFDVNKLNGMKRAELQKLCKTVGIKANMKNAQLSEALRQYAAQFPTGRKRSSGVNKQQLQNTFLNMAVAETVTRETNEPQGFDRSESYKKQILDQLEKKVEEKMPVECKIPRFVQFATNLKAQQDTRDKTSAPKWSKIHNSQFEKLDSIDVYLEKKRKRRESFNKCGKRAKSVGVSTKSVDKPNAVPAFKSPMTSLNKSATFVFGSPSAEPFFQSAKEARVSIATSASGNGKKLRLKSPKGAKPVPAGGATKSGQTRTPCCRRTITMATAVENNPKTPVNPSRKSMAIAPFRFSPANIPQAPTPTPRKRFDLKASLAKPLTYKPHTGKLKPLSTYREECRTTICDSKLKGRKVEVKSAKVTTREERRMKENKGREKRRANALSKQRGIVC